MQDACSWAAVHTFASDQMKEERKKIDFVFVLFWSNFWATFVTKKQLLTFLTTCEQRFEKLRVTFGEISSKLRKALFVGLV